MNLLIVETPAEAGAWRSVLSKAKGKWMVTNIGYSCMSVPTLEKDGHIDLLQERKECMHLEKMLYVNSDINRIHIHTQYNEQGNALAVILRDWLNEKWQAIRGSKGQKPGIVTRIVIRKVDEKSLARAIRKPHGFDDGKLHSYIWRTVMDQCTERHISDAIEKRVQVPLSLNRIQAIALTALVRRESLVLDGHKVTDWVLCTKFKNKITTLSEPCPYEGMANRYSKLIREPIKISPLKKVGEISPPIGLNTTSLIVEAAKRWKLNSMQVMNATHALYIDGMITSPLTQGHSIDPEVQKQVGGYLRKARMVYKKRPGYGHLAIQPTDVYKKPRKGLGNPKKGIKKPTDHVYSLIWEYTVASQMKPMKVEFHKAIVHRPHDRHRILGSAAGGKVIEAGFSEVLPSDPITPMTPGGWKVSSTVVEQRMSSPVSRWTEGDLIASLSEQGIDSPSLYLPVLEHLWSAKYIKVNNDGTIAPTVRGEFMVNTLNRVAPFMTDSKFTEYVESSLLKIASGKSGQVWVNGFVNRVLKRSMSSLASVQIVGKAPFCKRTQNPYKFMVHPDGDPYFANNFGDVSGVKFDEDGLATEYGSRVLPGKCKSCKEKTLITTRWWHGDKSSCTSCGADN